MEMMDSGTVSSCKVSFLILAAIAELCSSSFAKLKLSCCFKLTACCPKKSELPEGFVQVLGA